MKTPPLPISSSQPSDINSVIRAHPQAVSRMIDGQALILDLTRDEIRQLNEVGSSLWTLILEGSSHYEMLLDHMVNTFMVERVDARIDLDHFLNELKELNLIQGF